MQPKPPSQSDPAEVATRQRILARARNDFLAQGFRSVTMDDLAAELGMSKKTLYVHFPSKKALLEAIVSDKFRSCRRGLSLDYQRTQGRLYRYLAAATDMYPSTH